MRENRMRLGREKADNRYIANAPLVLATLGVLGLAWTLRRRRRRSEATTTASLVSPGGDDLERLEARVLVRSLAGVLAPKDEADGHPDDNGDSLPALPTHRDSLAPSSSTRRGSFAPSISSRRGSVAPTQRPSPGAPATREAEDTINSFRADRSRKVRRWASVYYWTQVVGAAVWLALEVYALLDLETKIMDLAWEDYRPLAFPVSWPLLCRLAKPEDSRESRGRCWR